MRRRTLFHFLTGTDVTVKTPRKRPLTPDAINHFFLEKGHVMEYYKVGPEEKRVVALFWGPGELVIPSHPKSIFLELDEITTGVVTYGKMIRQLRRDPAFRGDYRFFKWEYKKKENERLVAVLTMGPKERLAKLEEEQPWVFDLVAEEDIANYLRLNVGILRRLRGG
jgi:hypothetical protein